MAEPLASNGAMKSAVGWKKSSNLIIYSCFLESRRGCINLVPTSDFSYYYLVFKTLLLANVELGRKAIEQGFLVVKESEVSYQKPSSMAENESETVMEEFKNPQFWGKMNKNLHSQQYYIRTFMMLSA